MSRCILLLNPTLIFKGLFFSLLHINYPNYSKAFYSNAANPRLRVRSIRVLPCGSSQYICLSHQVWAEQYVFPGMKMNIICSLYLELSGNITNFTMAFHEKFNLLISSKNVMKNK